jgi:recombination protein RecA
VSDKEKSDKDKKTPSANSAISAKARAAIMSATGMKPLRPGSDAYSYVSTGSFPVDMLIGGSRTFDGKSLICPGFPRRRITEVFGAESSGKTTLLISAMVQAQRAGGKALLIDYEHSIDLTYAQRLGLSLDEDKMLVYQPDHMEAGLNAMYIGIMAGYDIIGVDSVAAMVPKSEFEKGFDDAAKIGAVAAKFSRELPKFVSWLKKYPVLPGSKEKKVSDPNHPGSALVFVNQVRALISTGGYGGGGGDQENTTGGKALKYFAFERLRLAKVRAEAIERVDPMSGKKRRYPYGNVTDVKVVKSKMDAKQGHSTQIFIRYGTGIDDYFSIIETGVAQKLVRKDGAFYTLNNERFKGRDAVRKYLIDNPTLYDALRLKLAELVNAGAVPAEPEEDDELAAFDYDAGDDDEDVAAIAEEVMTEDAAAE